MHNTDQKKPEVASEMHPARSIYVWEMTRGLGGLWYSLFLLIFLSRLDTCVLQMHSPSLLKNGPAFFSTSKLPARGILCAQARGHTLGPDNSRPAIGPPYPQGEF